MCSQRFLCDNDYPAFESHQEGHKRFAQQLVDFMNGYDEGRPKLLEEMLVYLKNWLLEHIVGSDQKWAAYLREDSREPLPAATPLLSAR